MVTPPAIALLPSRVLQDRCSLGTPWGLPGTELEGAGGADGCEKLLFWDHGGFFSFFKTSLSGCPRAKKSGARVTPTKDDKEDPELMK